MGVDLQDQTEYTRLTRISIGYFENSLCVHDSFLTKEQIIKSDYSQKNEIYSLTINVLSFNKSPYLEGNLI